MNELRRMFNRWIIIGIILYLLGGAFAPDKARFLYYVLIGLALGAALAYWRWRNR